MKTHNFHAGRAVDLVRGRTGTTVAGVGSIMGSPIAGTPTDGTILIYDATLDEWVVTTVSALTLGFLTRATGEQAAISVTTASGATLTLNLATANVFDITLTANCTLTFTNPPSSGVEGEWVLILRQGGTGSYTVTWPGSVVWRASNGTSTATAAVLATAVGAVDAVVIATLDGGVSYGAALDNGGVSSASFAIPALVLGTAAAAGVALTTIRSDATIIAFDATAPASVATSNATGTAAVAARRDHAHDGSLVVGPSDHAHVASETHLANGSTVTWTLDENFMTGSVIAWNTTTLARLTVTEVLPDQATVSAAGSSGDSIVFDYAAIVV